MTLNRSPPTDLNGCVKLLIEHLRVWGWIYWSYTMFSLGPDREYWYTEYRSTILDVTRLWNFFVFEHRLDHWRHVHQWILLCLAFSTLWSFGKDAAKACWCKYDHDKPSQCQISMINGLQDSLICLRLPWQTKCFIISINKSVWLDSTVSSWVKS